jgi:plasmid stabilization system protein ParE
MPFEYKIHEQAYREQIDAYKWYELRQTGLGHRFIDAIQNQIERIAKNPEQYSILRKKIRHVKVKGFPFTIVYEFPTTRGIIHIAAIFHTSRNPRKKFRKEDDY